MGGKRCGEGKLIQANGDVYQGQWKWDVKHGLGVLDRDDGLWWGEWNKGVLLFLKPLEDGHDDDDDQPWVHTPIETYYVGEYDQYGKRSGYGEFAPPGGGVYKGQWLHGKRHGEGSYQWPDGTRTYVGGWREGRRHGEGAYTENGQLFYGEWVNGQQQHLRVVPVGQHQDQVEGPEEGEGEEGSEEGEGKGGEGKGGEERGGDPLMDVLPVFPTVWTPAESATFAKHFPLLGKDWYILSSLIVTKTPDQIKAYWETNYARPEYSDEYDYGEDGADGGDGADGEEGADGEDGTDGEDGADRDWVRKVRMAQLVHLVTCFVASRTDDPTAIAAAVEEAASDLPESTAAVKIFIRKVQAALCRHSVVPSETRAETRAETGDEEEEKGGSALEGMALVFAEPLCAPVPPRNTVVASALPTDPALSPLVIDPSIDTSITASAVLLLLAESQTQPPPSSLFASIASLVQESITATPIP